MRSLSLPHIRSTTMSAVLLALSLSGCGGGGGGSDAPPAQVPGTSGNAAPTIQGQPAQSILAGQSYSFQPSASDANGDALTFSAANLPAWASLNASTGRLSGTPTSADIATYSGITISVSDGTATSALGPFAITVTAVGSGTATVSWLPPTQNADGSALTDLAGYEVRYGRNQNDLTQVIALTNASLSTYLVENLTSGTWYFAVIAVNAGGVTSPLSGIASKTIG